MSGMNVLYWNAQGMSSKIQEFTDLVRVEDIDIACVSETHFSCKSRIKDLPDYHLIRSDRATHMVGYFFSSKKISNLKRVTAVQQI